MDDDSRKSVTPPRPILPEEYVLEEQNQSSKKLIMISKRGSVEEPIPPRPPPPFQYTSTLPPPAPKKLRSKSNDFKSKTLPSRKSQNKQTAIKLQQEPNLASKSEQVSLLSDNDKKINSNIENDRSETGAPQPHFDVKSEKSQELLTQTNREQGTIFFTSFRKAASSSDTTINSLMAIGETDTISTPMNDTNSSNNDLQLSVISTNGVKNCNIHNAPSKIQCEENQRELDKWDDKESTEKAIHDDKRKRKKVAARDKEEIPEAEGEKDIIDTNSNNFSDSSPPSKRSSFENVKNVSCMSLDEPKKTIAVPINMTNLCLKQHPCVTLDKSVTQNYEMSNSKIQVATESLASRAKHESQTQFKKLKKNVSLEDFRSRGSHEAKTKQLDVRSSTNNKRISSGSNSSCSSISSSVEKSFMDKKQMGHISPLPHKMSPVLAIKNIMRKSDKDSRRKKAEKCSKSQIKKVPIVLEDKYSKVLIKNGDGKHSPTPSLASTASTTCTTCTDPSTLTASNLSLLSDLLTEEHYQHWLSSGLQDGKNNFKGIDDLDKYVSDMIEFTQDIQTPRASQIKGGKKSGKEFDELVKILDYKKRQSTNCEMKKSLQVIIDFIGDKNKTYHGNNLISSQTNLKIKYPTCNELTNYITEEVGDCFMDCHNEEQKATILFEDKKYPLLLLTPKAINSPTVNKCLNKDEGRPIPSPRFKRKNRLDGCSPTPSCLSSFSSMSTLSTRELQKSDSRVSLSSFNNMIQDLYQHSAGVEQMIGDTSSDNKVRFEIHICLLHFCISVNQSEDFT